MTLLMFTEAMLNQDQNRTMSGNFVLRMRNSEWNTKAYIEIPRAAPPSFSLPVLEIPLSVQQAQCPRPARSRDPCGRSFVPSQAMTRVCWIILFRQNQRASPGCETYHNLQPSLMTAGGLPLWLRKAGHSIVTLRVSDD